MGTSPAFQQKVIQANGLTFWTETFGNPTDPALFLIMGSGAQCILWPQSFCEQLANKGFFVIRYDNRDVGLSSTVDFQQTPYTILDMAKDGLAILDSYQLKKAHVVGASLGGVIAMLMASEFPDRVDSLTLLMTTTDLKPAGDALAGQPANGSLSQPKPEYLDWVKAYITNVPITFEDKVNNFIEGGRIITGSKSPFDEEWYRQIAAQAFTRMRNPANMFNHIKAMSNSHDLHTQAPSKIKTPTLIIHGDQDPILPMDHGEALKQALPHADYLLIEGMGHALNTKYYDRIIQKIEGITQASPHHDACIVG